MITLRQIQFALAVERHQHFKRAAQECNISQSALSLGIAELEKNLGVVLFERNNKQVLVTSIGKELLERARQIYLDAQQLVERAHAEQNHLSFSMNIGFIPTIAPYLLPKALPILQEQHPSFKLHIHEQPTETLLSNLHTGQIDAAVIALPYPQQNLDIIPFAEERFYVVANKQHPIAQQNSVKPNQLRQTDLLLLEEGHCLSEQIIDLCKIEPQFSKQYFNEASLSTLFQLAVNNMGVTLMPAISLESIAHYQQINTIALNAPSPHRQLAIATRNHYPRREELLHLAKLFAQSLANQQGVTPLL